MSLTTRHLTTTPQEGLASGLGGEVGEGTCWGGSGTVHSGYPAFLALVRDETGRIWPCRSSVATPIEFTEPSGHCSLWWRSRPS